MPAATHNPLEQFGPEDWATSWGQDECGVFVGFTIGGVEQRLRWVEPQTFTMGSPTDEFGRFEDEGPQRQVTLSRGFWVADTPVTQALWEAVMGDNPSKFSGDDARPVESVSWDDCQSFVSKLNDKVPGLSARLPTEAEWECACRAGAMGATYGGDLVGSDADLATLDAISWYSANSQRQTHPVGRKSPNAWGLHDTLGNVFEWCSDYWDSSGYGSSAAVENPTGPTAGGFRVVRGGSWYGAAGGVRAACRGGYHPGYRVSFVGLRLFRDQPVLG